MVDTKIIDGKQIAKDLKERLAKQVQQMAITPKLAVIVVGNHPASQIYVANKKKAAEQVGIQVDVYQRPMTETQDNLLQLIEELNSAKEVHGILLQLPVPEHLNERALLGAIAPQKDVDGLNPLNVGNMVSNLPAMIPCTPQGCMYLIKSVRPDLDGLNALVIGRSALVGKPLAHLLLQENCTVTLAHSHTKNLSELGKQADILVCAVGKPGLVNADMVKKGAVVIDVGINRLDNGKIVGDVLFLDMMGKASAVTPVPGGVGPMTITMLLNNVICAAQGQYTTGKNIIVKA